MTTFDILCENFRNACDEIEECEFQNDTLGVIRWVIIADTFAEML